jgi:hypothetical protein
VGTSLSNTEKAKIYIHNSKNTENFANFGLKIGFTREIAFKRISLKG